MILIGNLLLISKLIHEIDKIEPSVVKMFNKIIYFTSETPRVFRYKFISIFFWGNTFLGTKKHYKYINLDHLYALARNSTMGYFINWTLHYNSTLTSKFYVQINVNNFSLISDGQDALNMFNNRQQPKKKRKSRTAFTNHQIFELEKRFLYQKYLSPADRDEIASSLGLTNAQVITWFQNRRAKLKRDMEELKKDVESAKLLTAHKSFLENVTDLGILKKKSTTNEDDCSKNLVNWKSQQSFLRKCNEN